MAAAKGDDGPAFRILQHIAVKDAEGIEIRPLAPSIDRQQIERGSSAPIINIGFLQPRVEPVAIAVQGEAEVSSPLFKREQPNTLRVLYFVAVSYIPPKWRCPLCSSSNVRCVPRQREGDEHDPEWTLYQCKSCNHMWHRHKPAFGEDAGAAT